MKKRNPKLDFIKGIAIILVVIGHVVSQIWNTEPDIYENSLLFRFCYSFHMPLFVFISGWICRLTIKKDIRWLINRIRRIGIPYVIMILTVFVILRNGSISQFILSAPYWYLLFIIIADSILFLGMKIRCGILIFAPAYVIILLSAIFIPCDIGIIRQLADFIPFYTAGALMPVILPRIQKIKNPLLIISGTLYFIIFPLYKHGISRQAEYFREISGTESLPQITMIPIIMANKFVVPILGTAMVFLFTELIYNLNHTEKIRSALEKAGHHTLAIYLLHDLFFLRPFSDPVANSIISTFTAFFIPLITSYAYTIIRNKIRK